MRITTCLSIAISGMLLLAACAGQTQSTANQALWLAALQSQNSGDLPGVAGADGDYLMAVRDLRSTGRFAFETTATIQLSVAFAASAAAADQSSASAASLTESSADLLQFREASGGAGRVLFRAVPANGGTVHGLLTIDRTIESLQMDFAANGRSYSVPIDTRDLERINRTITMLTAAAESAPLNDSDSDGVPDSVDDFPEDAARATLLAFPSQGPYTIAYEDLFPKKGDADFNDYVVQARVLEELNAAGDVVRLVAKYRHVARAAGYKHILKLNLPIPAAAYSVRRYGPDGELLSTRNDRAEPFENIAITERSDRTIPQANAFAGQEFQPGDLFELEVIPDAPIAKATLGSAPYDLFLYVQNTKREVHFSGRFFNTDGSDQYLDEDGFPWVLVVPADWRWMYERVNIQTAYEFFDDWYMSGGRTNLNWFQFPDITKVFENVTTHLTPAPNFTPPTGFPASDFTITRSMQPVPLTIGEHYVPVGAVYDISPVSGGSVVFPGDPAQIFFDYDPDALAAAGFIEEFAVFYFDTASQAWMPVDRVVTDGANRRVIAYTSHLTPFVLTALPAPTGGQQAPAGPGCIADDYPAGIGGSGGALFSVVDTGFKYYQDRNYTIKTPAASPTNAGTFAAFGFEQALGISNCNGGGAPCGPTANHKLYTGNDYILFTAHADLDVYVMYDIRGGTGQGDTSQDATWLAGLGFVDTGRFLETTDGVQFYTVYQKAYNQGEQVALHGNRQGAGPGINTNYWVILKRRGVTASEPAAALCVASPDVAAPAPVTNLTAAPGANEILLAWANPGDADFAGVVIRRGTGAPPAQINDGVAATGTVINPQAFRDTSVTPGNTYFYTVFALDANNNFTTPGVSTSATTGPDSDNDSLSDLYENATNYSLLFPGSPAPDFTCALLPCPGVTDATDTDADGRSDGLEVAEGTDPTNPDNAKPVITDFTRTSPGSAENATVSFTLAGTDDTAITQWLITLSATPPGALDPGWQTIAPATYAVPATPATYQLFIWAKDAAGNISDPFAPIPFTLLAPAWVGTKFLGASSGGTDAQGIDTDALGNVYITGSAAGNALHGETIIGNAAIHLTKYSPSGVRVWTRTINSNVGGTAFGSNLRVGPTGSVYVAGALRFAPSNSETGFLAKYDTNGNQLWFQLTTSSIGAPPAPQNILVHGIAVDPADNVYLGGEIPALKQGFVARYDNAGNEIWFRAIAATGVVPPGWPAFVTATVRGVVVDSVGNVFFTGWASLGNIPGQPYFGANDFIYGKYDPAGTLAWSRQYGTTGAESQFGRPAVDSSDNLLMGGFSNANLGSPVGGSVLLKVDPNGNLLFIRQLSLSFSYGVATDSAGDIYQIGGTLESEFAGTFATTVLTKWSATGNQLWTRTIESTSSPGRYTGVAVDFQDSVFITGMIEAPLEGYSPPALPETFTMKFNAAGVKQ